MTTLVHKIVECRKFHLCVWCGEEIQNGEKAYYRVYIFDGEFMTDYLHIECHDATYKADVDPDEGFYPYSYSRGTHMLKEESYDVTKLTGGQNDEEGGDIEQ